MQYCPSCGTPVEGRFCPKCGTAMAAPGGYAGPPPPQVSQGLGIEENLAAALCYIPIVGLIFLLIDPYKQNRNVRFNAWQSLLYSLAGFIISIVLAIALGHFFFLMSLWRLAYLGGLILMAVKAYQRSPMIMPVIGPIAQKQAG